MADQKGAISITGTPWWVTLFVSVVGVVATMSVGDVFTVQGRLRRRLEKETAVVDKMSPGLLRDGIEALANRTAVELIVRTEESREVRQFHRLSWFVVVAFGVGMTGLAMVGLWLESGDPPGTPFDPTYRVFTIAGLGVVISATVNWYGDRRRIADIVDVRLAQLGRQGRPDSRDGDQHWRGDATA